MPTRYANRASYDESVALGSTRFAATSAGIAPFRSFSGLRAIPNPAIDVQRGNPSFERMKTCLPMLALLASSGCSDACENTVASSTLSPNGELAAVLFQRDCGATTGFSTQISILRPDGKLTGGGNAFIADDDHGTARVGSWEGSWAEAKWLAPDRLLIRYAAKSRLFKRSDRVSGVNITYQVVGG